MSYYCGPIRYKKNPLIMEDLTKFNSCEELTRFNDVPYKHVYTEDELKVLRVKYPTIYKVQGKEKRARRIRRNKL